MALHGYLVGEIAEDFGEGLLTRREALRRLGLLGLGLTAAGGVLAACGGDDDDDGDASATTTAAGANTTLPTDEPAGSSAALKAETISFTGPAGQLQGAYAAAKAPKGAVLVIHENRGLTPHFFEVPGRLAGAGYTALALDLLSRQGGTAKAGDEAAVQAALGNANDDDLVADMRAAITELQKRAPGQKIGALGFCFGGGMVWNLLNVGEDRIAAAVPFYGPAPATPDFSKAKAAVFSVYGADDARVNGTKAAADAGLQAAGLTHNSKVFAGAGHAFFNETGQRYNANAAKEAWSILLGWFDQHL